MGVPTENSTHAIRLDAFKILIMAVPPIIDRVAAVGLVRDTSAIVRLRYIRVRLELASVVADASVDCGSRASDADLRIIDRRFEDSQPCRSLCSQGMVRT